MALTWSLAVYYVQLILQVKDEGRSSKTGTAAVSVIVVRNLYSPVCSTANPDIVINFDTSPGKDIGFFNATDQDPNQVCLLWGLGANKS